jgi:hypothetical protein
MSTNFFAQYVTRVPHPFGAFCRKGGRPRTPTGRGSEDVDE